MRRSTPWVGLMLCGGLLAGGAQAQLSPQVRGNMHGADARLNFTWSSANSIIVQPNGRSLHIQFDQPAAVDSSALLQQLAPYVMKVEKAADGKSITLTTDKPYKVRSFASGVNNGFDLLDVNDTGPSGKKQTFASPAAEPVPQLAQWLNAFPHAPAHAKPVPEPLESESPIPTSRSSKSGANF